MRPLDHPAAVFMKHALGIAFSLFVAAIEFANSIPLLVMSNGLLLPVSGLMILGLANIRGWAANLLSLRPLVIMGESSYAVYLLHMPIWFYFVRLRPINTFWDWTLYMSIVISTRACSHYGLGFC